MKKKWKLQELEHELQYEPNEHRNQCCGRRSGNARAVRAS